MGRPDAPTQCAAIELVVANGGAQTMKIGHKKSFKWIGSAREHVAIINNNSPVPLRTDADYLGPGRNMRQ